MYVIPEAQKLDNNVFSIRFIANYFIPKPVIEETVPRWENERSCVLGSIEFGTISTVWNFLFFILLVGILKFFRQCTYIVHVYIYYVSDCPVRTLLRRFY